ncbi:MAG: iron-containing redox enzyme family protein [Myxococcota bacterium]
MGPGELVGDAALVDGAPAHTVVARTDTRARRIDRVAIVSALAVAPAELRSLLDTVARLGTGEPTGAAYVAQLCVEALDHRAVRHPYLRALGEGDLPDVRWALADFARHYYGYSRHFPRYLTTVMSRLEQPAHRQALLENLTEEAGVYSGEDLSALADIGVREEWIVGQPHPVLFRRFCTALGVEDDGRTEADQVVCWRELFLGALSNGSPAEAVGALGLGTENIVSTMYLPFVRAIDGLGLDPHDTVFFPLHTAIDDHHQATLNEIATSFAGSDAGRAELRRGMIKALSCRSAFWDWLGERAADPARADRVL